LDEVLFHLTGKDLDPKDYGLPSDEDYNNIMKSLQVALCQRTDEIMKDLDPLEKNLSAEINSIKEKAINSTNGQDYYSAASYCFSNNIKVKKEYYFQKKVSPISLAVLVKNLNSKTEALEDKLSEQKIDTISDLQALMIVKERISDVKKNVQKANSSLTGLETITYLSYGEERLFTAISWMQFFDLDGKKFAVDQDSLRNSCLQKIAESEERYQYALLFLPENYLLHIEEKIAQAEESLGLGENELCLITASQAKADANAILSTFGLDEQSLPRFIQAKRLAVEKTITRNSAEGTFPILGYSYYRYALTFEESEPYTSLLYLEYALEMSELEIYFPEESTVSIFSNLRFSKEIYIFAFGLVVGIILSALYQVLKPKKNFKKEL
jgi:predicted S18 family serine protease